MTNEITTVDNEEMFSLASLDAGLQAKILAASQMLKASAPITINRIRLDAKAFIFPDGTEVQSFSGIIVAVKHANIHYSGEYEEGKSNPPDCIAVLDGSNDVPNTDLSPRAEVITKFNPTCAGCPKLAWGSDRGGKGKGKECAEHVLLAVYVPSVGDDLLLFEAKKGNAKTADGYLAITTNKYGHPIAVTTLFTMGEKAKWAQDFVAQNLATKELVTNLAGRMDEANEMLLARVTDAYKRGLVSEAAPAVDPAATPPGRTARARSE